MYQKFFSGTTDSFLGSWCGVHQWLPGVFPFLVLLPSKATYNQMLKTEVVFLLDTDWKERCLF